VRWPPAVGDVAESLDVDVDQVARLVVFVEAEDLVDVFMVPAPAQSSSPRNVRRA
jgi:hypothetical protein